MNKYSLSSLLTLMILSQSVSFAATPINLRNESQTLMHSLSVNPQQAHIEFKSVSHDTDFNKTLHTHMQQTYQGFPVWGANVISHAPQVKTHLNNAAFATPEKMNGTIFQNLDPDLKNTPTYVKSDAQADKALRHAVELYEETKGIKATPTYIKKQLMVYVDKNNKAHWAFYVNFTQQHDKALPEKPSYILDATDLSVYQKWNNLHTEDYPNAYLSGYGGNEKSGRTVIPSVDIVRDDATQICYLKNEDVIIKNVDGATEKFPCKIKSNKEYYWDGALDPVNGAYSPSNDSIENAMSVKYLYQSYDQNVLTDMATGKPLQLEFHIHEDMDNAYFDQETNTMVFGDGDEEMYPLTSLGVTAHELSHGFTSQHSALVYQGQSGALDESFSDMAAQIAEYYRYRKSSWKIGAEIMKGDGALRYMDNPRQDCVDKTQADQCSINTAKDYYEGMDVHYASGVFNRAFYLLSTSPNWNTRKAFDVMVQANIRYWVPTTTFTEAACGVLDATRDYGYDTQTVVNVMSKVGIDTKGC